MAATPRASAPPESADSTIGTEDFREAVAAWVQQRDGRSTVVRQEAP